MTAGLIIGPLSLQSARGMTDDNMMCHCTNQEHIRDVRKARCDAISICNPGTWEEKGMRVYKGMYNPFQAMTEGRNGGREYRGLNTGFNLWQSMEVGREETSV